MIVSIVILLQMAGIGAWKYPAHVTGWLCRYEVGHKQMFYSLEKQPTDREGSVRGPMYTDAQPCKALACVELTKARSSHFHLCRGISLRRIGPFGGR